MNTGILNFTSPYLRRKCLLFSALLMLLLIICGNSIICPSNAEAFSSSLTALDENPINARTPLILIHGLKGKTNPIYWQNFINYFNSNNLLTNKYKLYKFEYDSNEVDVYTIGLALKNDIDNLPEFNTVPGGRKFVIIAHSMGGLVARSYMQEHGGSERIIKLITLATPHHGSPLANDAPRTGSLTDPYLDTALDLIDSSFWCKGDLLYNTICLSGTYSIEEPNRKDMLWDSYNDPSGAYNQCPECNPWLQNLNSLSGSYNNKLILYYGYQTSANSSLYDSLADMGSIGLVTYLLANSDDIRVQLAGASVILYHVYLAGDGLVPYDSGAFYAGAGISDSQRRLFPGYDHDQMKDGVVVNGAIPLFNKIKHDLESIANIAKNDFNGDGNPDILWSNKSTGSHVLWLMNNDGTRAGYKILLIYGQSTIVGTGDFNADGISDILWRNASTGAHVLWFMKSDGTYSSSKVLLTNVKWTIAGTGDFNNDGISDILWRNASTGAHVLWFMKSDGTYSSNKVLLANVKWTIAGTGDFNNDGISDILWSNASTGAHVLWFMKSDGTYSSNKVLLIDGQSTIAGTGDFNADGISDILWSNASTGAHILWFMKNDGTQLSNKVIFANVKWTIAGTGDFNRDGISDILWRNASTGSHVLWFMKSDGTYSGNKVLLTNLAWTIEGN